MGRVGRCICRRWGGIRCGCRIRSNVDLRVSRGVRVRERVLVRGLVEVFNVANQVNYSGVTQRAFLVGTAVNGVTPLVFQDAAAVAAEGLNVLPFGAFTAASDGCGAGAAGAVGVAGGVLGCPVGGGMPPGGLLV